MCADDDGLILVDEDDEDTTVAIDWTEVCGVLICDCMVVGVAAEATCLCTSHLASSHWQ